MGPGPSNVSSQVLKEMAQPLIGHMDPQFIEMMDEVKDMVRHVFLTNNPLTFVIPGTGSAGMECAFVNLIEPGDQVLVCVNGAFGNRMCEIALRCDAKLKRLDVPWGQPVAPTQVANALQNFTPKIVAIVHAETSTGVLQPLEEISRIVHKAGALFLVDAVTSLGGCELKIDEWGIDICYSATQKCLSAPPGLSPISFSPAAESAINTRKSRIQSWYLDVSLIQKYWDGKKRAYHHTAPISMIYAIHRALKIVLEEGLETRINRHHNNYLSLKTGLEAMGFEYIIAHPYRLPVLNTIKIPDGLDDDKTRMRLLNEYNIEIGGGLGDFAGKIWRIGIMGESCSPDYIKALLSALKKILSQG